MREFPAVITARMTAEDAAWLEKMRVDGGEYESLGPLVRSLLQALITDDKAAEGAS